MMRYSAPACIEMATIVQDIRPQVAGGFLVALRLYKVCIVPSLLYNSSTWTEIPKAVIKIIKDFQHCNALVYTVTGAHRAGAPLPSLRSKTGVLEMDSSLTHGE